MFTDQTLTGIFFCFYDEKYQIKTKLLNCIQSVPSSLVLLPLPCPDILFSTSCPLGGGGTLLKIVEADGICCRSWSFPCDRMSIGEIKRVERRASVSLLLTVAHLCTRTTSPLSHVLKALLRPRPATSLFLSSNPAGNTPKMLPSSSSVLLLGLLQVLRITADIGRFSLTFFFCTSPVL